MTLTDAQFEVFQLLTQRPLLVLDTEYTRDPGGDGDRLISLAIVPVIRGRRVPTSDLYVEMNPGVPIEAASTAVHGFTDAEVARKRTFAHYADKIVTALAVPDAVLITHTGVDVRVLRRELERLDEAAASIGGTAPVGLAQLPVLPILDTSTLPRQLGLPGVGNRGVVSLATLCELTGVTNTGAHHARGDARATAEALLQLLRHVARTKPGSSVQQLIESHGQGTTAEPTGAGYIRSRRDKDPVLPPEHLARHDVPLTHPGSDAELAAWIDRARECAQLRCEHLRTEAALAAPSNGKALFDPLVALLPALLEPGQPGTLVGGVAALIDHAEQTSPTLAYTRALRWWGVQRPAVARSAACGDRRVLSCPDCRHSQGCPRDLLYQSVTRVAVLGERGVLDEKSINDRLFGKRPDRRINDWPEHHPRETAYMAWMVISWEDERRKASRALDHLRAAMDKKLHHAEPRLALMACQALTAAVEADDALHLATEVLRQRTSDPAYGELAAWVRWHQQASALAGRRSERRVITHPRLARPPGRVNANPYLPT